MELFIDDLLFQKHGKEIFWQHLIDLYKRDHGKGSGLSLVPKLKYEHVYLTSFSKMRVDLAAQVLLLLLSLCLYHDIV